jgi:hypothetical protein
MIIRVTDVWKHSVLRLGRERWYKPAKKNCRTESTKELCTNKSRGINWTDSGKCVCERTRERHGRIGKGR